MAETRWVNVFSVTVAGFTEENIDEIKETLRGSNLYLLILTALVTALHVRSHSTPCQSVLWMEGFPVISSQTH